MPFGTPFADVMVADGSLSVLYEGEWFEVAHINGIPAGKLIKVAGALDAKDDAQSFLQRKLHEVMDAVDSPLEEFVTVGVQRDGQPDSRTIACPSLEVDNLEAKLKAAQTAFAGVIQLAKCLGADDAIITKAYLLAAADGPDMTGMDNPMAQMAAQMAAMGAGGPGGPAGGKGECQQQ